MCNSPYEREHAVGVTMRAACACLLASALFVAVLLKPAVILYPLSIVLGVLISIVVYAAIVISNFNHLEVQKDIDDAYRIPGTEIVLRTTFADWSLATAPYLEVRVGDGPPLKFCMAGPALTRAQLYSVEGGRFLLETSRDSFLINTAPFSVDGPPSWMRSGVFVNEHGSCDYDARSDASEHERNTLKSGLKPVYLGAFDADGAYRRFWPAFVSPEQKIAPPFAP